MKYNARFHFTKNNTTFGKHFDGLIQICEHTMPFGTRTITFWHGLADLTHETADLEFFNTMANDPEAFIFVQLQDGRHGRGVCVAGEVAGNYFSVAIAGCESF
jgi:hypothetical protein